MKFPQNSDRKLIFLHVPKAGGTSLHDFIMEHYSPSALCPQRNMGLRNCAIDGYDVFSGHYYRDDLDDPRLPDAYRLAILRNPMERVLSNYNFWRGYTDQHLAANDLTIVQRAKHATLREFLAPAGPFSVTSQNAVTKRLCTNPDSVNARSDEDSAAEAIDYLSEFDMVFITEFMDIQLPQFCSDLGWSNPTESIWRRDRSRNHLEEPEWLEQVELVEYSEETRQLARQINGADIILYKHFLEKVLQEHPCEIALSYHALRRKLAVSVI